MPTKYDAGADASLAQAKKNAAVFKKMLQANQGGHHEHETPAVRVATHKGHRIEVKTTYEVKVDGKKLAIKFAPDQDGSVFYHPVPNRSFTSAMDLIRCIIDVFPADFAAAGKKPKKAEPVHDHDHGAAPRKRAVKVRKAGN